MEGGLLHMDVLGLVCVNKMYLSTMLHYRWMTSTENQFPHTKCECSVSLTVKQELLPSTVCEVNILSPYSLSLSLSGLSVCLSDLSVYPIFLSVEHIFSLSHSIGQLPTFLNHQFYFWYFAVSFFLWFVYVSLLMIFSSVTVLFSHCSLYFFHSLSPLSLSLSLSQFHTLI